MSSKEERKQRLASIKQRIKNLGYNDFTIFLGRKEINQLPDILFEDEVFENIAIGQLESNTVALVATNKRLIFIDKGFLQLQVKDYRYDKISSVEYELGFATGKLKIQASRNKLIIENVPNQFLKKFADFVREKTLTPAEPVQSKNSTPSFVEQIEKLAKLQEKGFLTLEEFESQKKKLLKEYDDL
jgi:hypothetical protein